MDFVGVSVPPYRTVSSFLSPLLLLCCCCREHTQIERETQFSRCFVLFPFRKLKRASESPFGVFLCFPRSARDRSPPFPLTPTSSPLRGVDRAYRKRSFLLQQHEKPAKEHVRHRMYQDYPPQVLYLRGGYGNYDGYRGYRGYGGYDATRSGYPPQNSMGYGPYPGPAYPQGYDYPQHPSPMYGGGPQSYPNSRVYPFPQGRGVDFYPRGGRGGGFRGDQGFRGGRGGPRKKKSFVGGSLATQKEWEQQTACCFFLQGKCKFGENCRFLHEDSGERPCQFGDRCRVHGKDAHENSPSEEGYKKTSASNPSSTPNPEKMTEAKTAAEAAVETAVETAAETAAETEEKKEEKKDE